MGADRYAICTGQTRATGDGVHGEEQGEVGMVMIWLDYKRQEEL